MILTSDHRCIFDIQTDIRDVKFFRNPRTTNWDVFTTSLNSNLGNYNCKIENIEDIESCSSFVTDLLSKSFETACPLRRLCSKRNPPWWNAEIAKLRKSVRSKYNKMKKTNRLTDTEKYKTELKLFKKTIQYEKRCAFRNFCESIEDYPAISRLHKALSKDTSYQLGFLQKPDGEYTVSSEETAKLLMETHFPSTTNSIESLYVNNSNEQCWELAQSIVTKQKIIWAANSFSPYKSAGPDGVIPAMIQKSITHLTEILLKLFQGCLALGYIPKSWKSSKVIFIPKPGKTNYFDPKSFRPISLQSCMLKILERIIEHYIRHTVKLTVSPSQHAYMPGKSVDTALHNLITRIERSMDYKQNTLGVFLDIEGAFDRTTVSSICNAAIAHRIDPFIVKWIKELLTNRIAYTVIAGSLYDISVNRGCPQGGVLSPLLWTLVVDSLLTNLNGGGFYSQGYADDIIILVSGSDGYIMSQLMNNALSIVKSWCENQSLSVNPAKTKMVLFTRKNIVPSLPVIEFCGSNLSLVNEVKFLGIIIDNKLSFNKHLENKMEKLRIAFWQCRRVFGQTWGLKPKVLYWIYTVIIKPNLCYACHIWWPKTKQVSVIQKLDKFQRMALIAITGAMKTTPTRAIETLLGIAPLNIFIQTMAKRISCRLFVQKSWNIYGNCVGHRQILSDLLQGCPDIAMTHDYMKPSIDFDLDKSFNIIIPTRESWTNNNIIANNTYQMIWFSDGSLMNGNAGAGIFSPSENIEQYYSLGKYCSIFQAELFALIRCTDYVIHSMVSDCRICFCSDSQAVLKATDNPRSDSKLITELKQKLNVVHNRSNRIDLIWVPGHSSIEGNEKADELARSGASKSFHGPEPALGITVKMCTNWIMERSRREHIATFNNSTGLRQAKMFIKISSYSDRNFLLDLKKHQIKLLTEVLSGHTKLNLHLQRIGISTDTICPICQEDMKRNRNTFCADVPHYIELDYYISKKILSLITVYCGFEEIYESAPDRLEFR